MVECDLAKVEVAGSNPVFRSNPPEPSIGRGIKMITRAYSENMLRVYGAIAKW